MKYYPPTRTNPTLCALTFDKSNSSIQIMKMHMGIISLVACRTHVIALTRP